VLVQDVFPGRDQVPYCVRSLQYSNSYCTGLLRFWGAGTRGCTTGPATWSTWSSWPRSQEGGAAGAHPGGTEGRPHQGRVHTGEGTGEAEGTQRGNTGDRRRGGPLRRAAAGLMGRGCWRWPLGLRRISRSMRRGPCSLRRCWRRAEDSWVSRSAVGSGAEELEDDFVLYGTVSQLSQRDERS